MDTKKLRQKILDLAIHGKLVPQDPNDEPASVLLERIKAEKERLLEEGKIKKGKKSAKTSDTPHYENVPFEVPDNWVWTTIEEICSKIGSGSTPRGSNYAVDGIPFFRSQNVYNDRLVYDDIKYISDETHQKMKGTEVLANDLLLNITGGSLGRCAVVPADFNRGNVSQHVCIMRPILVEPEYFHALILSSYFAKSIKITGSGREGLPKYSLEQMAFPLPPLAVQHRIVAEIERWFSLIDQIEQGKADLQTTIKQTKSKILDLAIHGKFVPQDPNDEPAIELLKRISPDFTPCDNGHSGKLPQGWCYCNYKDVFSDVPSKAYQILQSDIQNDGKYPVISQSVNYIEGYTNTNNVFQHKIPCIIFGDHTRNVKYVDFDFVVGADGVKILCPKVNVKWSFYMIMYASSHIENKGYSRHFGQIIKFSYKLPPIAEQQRIVQKIGELFSVLDNIQKALEV